jgi:hypothetical protein
MPQRFKIVYLKFSSFGLFLNEENSGSWYSIQTGHSGNETLLAGAFMIAHTKCQKRGFLEEFWGLFDSFVQNVTETF